MLTGLLAKRFTEIACTTGTQSTGVSKLLTPAGQLPSTVKSIGSRLGLSFRQSLLIARCCVEATKHLAPSRSLEALAVTAA